MQGNFKQKNKRVFKRALQIDFYDNGSCLLLPNLNSF